MAKTAFLCVLLACVVTAGQAYGREISEKRECSICHVMWLNDFQQEGVTTLIAYDPKPRVATGKQDVVSTERMCFSCHDGFVRDSRFAWAKREHFHPVGIEPPPHIEIPKIDGKDIFPLNEEGKIYCGTCHSAHGVDWKEEYSPLFLRVQNRDSSLCLACHLERSTGPKEGHHPVFRPLETIPERLVEEGAKFGAQNDVVCQSCHRIHGAGDDKLLVVNNEGSALCGTCHADRYTHSREQAARARTHPVNIIPKGVEIPSALIEEGARLGPNGEVICQTCHSPHWAQKSSSILVASNKDSALCQRCHMDKKTVAETSHDLTRTEHAPENGVCGSCHRPHGGEGPKMWAREPAESHDPMASTCLSCHQDGAPAEGKQVGEHSHPIGRDLARVDNRKGLPGFNRDGLKAEKGGRVSCPSCHDPHRWSAGDPERRTGGEGKFLRVDDQPKGALCLSCHGDKGAVGESPHAPAQVASKAREKGLGFPSDTGLCGACHQVHNGSGARMWALRPGADTDPVSSLCLSCHSAGGPAEDRTVGGHSHPTNVSIENIGIVAEPSGWIAKVRNLFEMGTPQVLPLFDGEGDRVSSGGNVTCATCHDPHNHRPTGGEQVAEARFLRLPNDAEATLCRNCHRDKGQVGLSKHNLAITAPGEKNIEGVAASEGHVCEVCHLPHNGSGSRMWAGFTRESDDPVAELCLGCHQDGGVAEKKQVGQHSHPVRVDVKSVGLDTQLPLFRSDGERDAADGRVSCATCHDPHQWQAGEPHSEAGAHADVEGDGTASFLRIASAKESSLCVDCHEDKRWVRGTDHDLAVTSPDAANGQGQTIDGSGVCSACHTPHNAEASRLLWARHNGPGQDVMESYCRSCHAAGELAEAKLPLNAAHPPDVRANSRRGWPRPGKLRAHFPIYDRDGNEVDMGVISCPTCHNPHRWRSGKDREGSGRNLEGDVRNSFLRNKSESSLCTNCHGMDALFRYKYYHGDSSRVPHRLYR